MAITKRVIAEIRQDQVGLLAAGVAFYAMLAVFPALIAVILVYGMVADPDQVAEQLRSFAQTLPEGADQLLIGQLEQAAAGQPGGLTLGLAISLAGVLWSASAGMAGLMRALNRAYDEEETRKFFKLRGLALLLTLGAILTVVIVLGVIAVLPAVLDRAGLGAAGRTITSWGRWPVLAVLVVLGLAVVYRYAPDRANPRWRWVTPGALLAVLFWLLASIGFGVYVSNFGNYNKTYGSLGAVIVLLLWLFVSAFVILLGAEIDAEMERQTTRDTTTGPEAPMGERDAQAADTVAGQDTVAAQQDDPGTRQ